MKLYHKLLPLSLFPICLLIIIGYGWMGYATITDRPGANGSFYLYLKLSKIHYISYNLIVGCIALFFMFVQIKFLFAKQSKQLNQTFWIFLLYLGLLTICEIYLYTRFEAKG